MAAAEQLTLDAIRILHPPCGGVILLTTLDAEEGYVTIEGICYRCDRYVSLVYKSRLDAVPTRWSAESQEERLALLTDAIRRSYGNLRTAAKLLHISRRTMYTWVQHFGIDWRQYREPGKVHRA